jgi:hypothetical protein
MMIGNMTYSPSLQNHAPVSSFTTGKRNEQSLSATTHQKNTLIAQVGATFTGLLGDNPQRGLGVLKRNDAARWYPFKSGSGTDVKGRPVSDDTVRQWANGYPTPEGSCYVEREDSVICAFPQGNASFHRNK